MNANKLAKHNEVKEISTKLANAKALVVAEYAGLSVKDLQELRKEFKAKGVEAKVYKNRLFKIAAKDAGFEDLNSSLIGPNLYVFGNEDDLSAAKIVFNFAKDHQALKMKAGIYEQKVVDQAALNEIAILPTWEEAITILARSLQGPLQQMSIGLKMLVDEEKLAAPAA